MGNKPIPSHFHSVFPQDYNVLFVPPQEGISDREKEALRDIAARDPLAEISEQEKVISRINISEKNKCLGFSALVYSNTKYFFPLLQTSLWKLRRHCCTWIPEILPRFLVN